MLFLFERNITSTNGVKINKSGKIVYILWDWEKYVSATKVKLNIWTRIKKKLNHNKK